MIQEPTSFIPWAVPVLADTGNPIPPPRQCSYGLGATGALRSPGRPSSAGPPTPRIVFRLAHQVSTLTCVLLLLGLGSGTAAAQTMRPPASASIDYGSRVTFILKANKGSGDDLVSFYYSGAFGSVGGLQCGSTVDFINRVQRGVDADESENLSGAIKRTTVPANGVTLTIDLCPSAQGKQFYVVWDTDDLIPGNAFDAPSLFVASAPNCLTEQLCRTLVTVGYDNESPVFSGGNTSTRSFNENSSAGTPVGSPVAATDSDGDSLTYTLGGADAARFSISSTTGQILTKSGITYDYESRTSYTVTVRVADTTDGMAQTTVMISVRDVDEPPDVPGAPTVTASGETSLNVAWSAPGNSGRPAISRYDIRYRDADQVTWQELSAGSSATMATLTGLSDGLRYEVQVRAHNAEGMSPWSPSGTAVLGAATAFRLSVIPSAIREDEGQNRLTITATLNGHPRDEPTIVTVSKVQGTASDEDYEIGTLPSISIPAGSSQGSARVTFTAVDDGEVDSLETVVLQGEAEDLGTAKATIIIVDPLGGEPVNPDPVSPRPATPSSPSGSSGSPVRSSPDPVPAVAPSRPAPLQISLWTDRPDYVAGNPLRLLRTVLPHSDNDRYSTLFYLEPINPEETESEDGADDQRRYLVPASVDGGMREERVDWRGLAQDSFHTARLEEVSGQLVWEGPAPEAGIWRFVMELLPAQALQQTKHGEAVPGTRRASATFTVAEQNRALNVPRFQRFVTRDMTLSNNYVYYLRDRMFVADGVTLTIEPGTVVRAFGGRASITVERGGKIEANGTADAPVVLTCAMTIGQRQRGCWGGVRLLGRAPVTRVEGTVAHLENGDRAGYGGTEAEDSSGTLRFVRVEFAGANGPNGEATPALGLYGVGSGTTVESVQVRESLTEGIHLSGGTVECTDCVASGAGSTALSWERGWRGGAHNLFVQQGEGDGGGLAGLNDPESYDAEPRSLPVLDKATIVHVGLKPDEATGLLLEAGSGLRGSHLVIAGFRAAGLSVGQRAALLFADGTSQVSESILFGNSRSLAFDQILGMDSSEVGFEVSDPMLFDVRYFANPDPRPHPDSDALAAVPQGEDPIGAFGGELNWLEWWTVFGAEVDYRPDEGGSAIEAE